MKAFLSALALLAASAAFAQAPVPGEVQKVDAATNRITIKHGEIKQFDMPAMTMVYRVRDPKLLQGVVAGDRVKFVAEKIEGNYTVTAIQKGS